ncbi:MAG: hypothetical protein Q7T36_17200 [Fluviicoccus sp.]|uniref:PEP-CTERM sorting domain-containing protein n=1 Tax=Fluviicoccus sp. TaxID=2003552 RepID=UPI00271EA3A7|nr:PEP-CTERM sorting domain-containing protein [Fluviicoccus sp.]MDO8332205.1 hypothetical protein [Fluviicoccus sp.]
MKLSQMKTHRKTIASALVAAVLGLGYAGGASANLVFLFDSDNTGGEGYGNVINLLSMQKPGGAGTGVDIEDGKVAWNGSVDVITSTTGFVLTDPNKTATHTFGSVGLSGSTAASQLRLLWDPSETGSASGDDTQVNSLILSIYAPGGGPALFTASLAAPVFHDHIVGPGLGVGDFVYGLDTAQAGTLQGLLTGIGDFSSYRIGLESNVSFVDDGPDTWLLARGGPNEPPCVPSPANNFCGQQQIPEPGILSLVAVGLLGTAAATRKRRPA